MESDTKKKRMLSPPLLRRLGRKLPWRKKRQPANLADKDNTPRARRSQGLLPTPSSRPPPVHSTFHRQLSPPPSSNPGLYISPRLSARSSLRGSLEESRSSSGSGDYVRRSLELSLSAVDPRHVPHPRAGFLSNTAYLRRAGSPSRSSSIRVSARSSLESPLALGYIRNRHHALEALDLAGSPQIGHGLSDISDADVEISVTGNMVDEVPPSGILRPARQPGFVLFRHRTRCHDAWAPTPAQLQGWESSVPISITCYSLPFMRWMQMVRHFAIALFLLAVSVAVYNVISQHAPWHQIPSLLTGLVCVPFFLHRLFSQRVGDNNWPRLRPLPLHLDFLPPHDYVNRLDVSASPSSASSPRAAPPPRQQGHVTFASPAAEPRGDSTRVREPTLQPRVEESPFRSEPEFEIFGEAGHKVSAIDLCHVGGARSVPINATVPSWIESTLFEGRALLKLRPSQLDPNTVGEEGPRGDYARYWSLHPERSFQLQVQGWFKNVPRKTRIYIGAELDSPPLNFKSRCVLQVLINRMGKNVAGLEWSPGTKQLVTTRKRGPQPTLVVVRPFIIFPLVSAADRLIATPSGEEAPKLGIADLEPSGSRPSSFDTQHKYSMSYSSANIDFASLQVGTNLLRQLGKHPIRLVAFQLKRKSAHFRNKQGKDTLLASTQRLLLHAADNKDYLFVWELRHQA